MAAAIRPPEAKAPTIVIVDDEVDILLALSDALRAALPQARIFPAESATAALEFIHEQHADLVIADWRMPGLSGVDLVEILKRTPKPPAAILMTGHPSIGLANRAINLHGFAAIFSKPFDPDVMAETAIQLLTEAMGHRPATAGATPETRPSRKSPRSRSNPHRDPTPRAASRPRPKAPVD